MLGKLKAILVILNGSEMIGGIEKIVMFVGAASIFIGFYQFYEERKDRLDERVLRSWEMLYRKNVSGVVRGRAFTSLIRYGEAINGEDLSKQLSDDKKRRIQVKLQGVQASNHKFKGSLIYGLHFDDANFTNATLDKTDLALNSFTNSDLSGIHYSGPGFKQSLVANSSLIDATITNTDFYNSVWLNVDATNASIRKSSLDHCILVAVDFRGADLTSTILTDTNISGSDFRGSMVTLEQLKKACIGSVYSYELEKFIGAPMSLLSKPQLNVLEEGKNPKTDFSDRLVLPKCNIQ